MTKMLIVCAALLCALVPSAVAQPAPDSVLVLFDGRALGAWTPASFGAEGQVAVEDSSIVLYRGDPLTGVTWTGPFPTDNYELTFRAMRVEGSDFFSAVTFPVGEQFCTLVLGGWGGALVGLSSIDGADASENLTRTSRRFEDGRWYRVRLRVADGAIRAWVDDDPIVDFTIDDHELGIRVEVTRSKPFGIASYRTTAALRDLVVRRL